MADEPNNPVEEATGAAVAAPAAVPVVEAIPLPTGTVIPLGTTMPITGMAVQQVQVWQGQFPPPDAVERYEATMPGAFDRLMRMAERQQDAAIEAGGEARAYLRADTKRGHYLGFLVTVFAILGAIVCAYLGQPWVAAALVGVPVLSVAKALIDSTRAVPTAQIQVPVAAATAVEDKSEHEDEKKSE